MVLRAVDKNVLKRLRLLLKREQNRSGQVVPKRALEFFGRLKNIDARKLNELYARPGLIERLGLRDMSSGFAVRLTKVKGAGGVVLKLSTLATNHFHVTPLEEIRFVRNMVNAVNDKLPNEGFVIRKPIGHPVGPFIAMRQTTFSTIRDVSLPVLTPKTKDLLARLSRETGVPAKKIRKSIIEIGNKIERQAFVTMENRGVVLSKNYLGSVIKNFKGEEFPLKPLNKDHLQIIGQKNGVIQLVPYIDAI